VHKLVKLSIRKGVIIFQLQKIPQNSGHNPLTFVYISWLLMTAVMLFNTFLHLGDFSDINRTIEIAILNNLAILTW
jgi:hypothetical protein